MPVIQQRHPDPYDLVVIGGGMSGVCAAVAAARRGCRTALVQDRPVLGGNSSSEIRMHVCGADHVNDGQARRETGILEELRLANLVRNPQNSPSMWDLLLYEWVTREPGIDLYLNTLALEPVMAGATRIEAVRARQLASELEFTLEGTLFADCSGDGQVGAQTGANFRRGREACDEFGESLANEKADRFSLGSSILFMARDMGRPMPFAKPDWANTYPTDESLAHRGHGRYRFGYWWIEWGGMLDTIKDNDRIRGELMKIALGVWDHIKNHGEHGAENWALEWIGFVPGKRESRRFLGDYVLRQQDLEEGRVFEDEVAYGGWPIDTHPIGGINAREKPCTQINVPLYSIPLRSLYSRNIENLFFAGRNMSATHIAFASTRVMSTCAVMGQAVGTAAAVCVRRGLTPRAAATEGIADVQQALLADGCYLLGGRNTDPDDLAKSARVTASGSSAGMEPVSVIDGVARPVGGEAHCWESRPLTDGAAWIALEWPEPKRLASVAVTFDSHLEQRLIFTQEDHFYKLPHTLAEIPERLVKAFDVQARENDEWRTVASVAENVQRRCVVRLDSPVTTPAIRLLVHETHGGPCARVFETRAYGQGG